MVAHALAEKPNECVGLLAGVVEGGVARVVERYPLANVAETPAVEYFGEVKMQVAAHKDMRRRGLDVVAIYHSHPTSEPVPSRKDRERDCYEGFAIHFIIGLTTDPPEVRGWWLTPDDYRPAEWLVVEE
jgi:proteasome lid subunit RPN8/RPN11